MSESCLDAALRGLFPSKLVNIMQAYSTLEKTNFPQSVRGLEKSGVSRECAAELREAAKRSGIPDSVMASLAIDTLFEEADQDYDAKADVAHYLHRLISDEQQARGRADARRILEHYYGKDLKDERAKALFACKEEPRVVRFYCFAATC
ncbi:MAG: hypothetical protein ACFWTZ_07075 [Burkholderia sp.]|jgi:hypothetical protein